MCRFCICLCAEYLRQHIEDFILPYPVLLDDIKKNEEYMAILDVSMAARAAIEGGVSSHEAFLSNDVFLKKISLYREIAEIQKLKIEGIIHFAELVHKNKQSGSTNRPGSNRNQKILGWKGHM